jgi:hypothetical protein
MGALEDVDRVHLQPADVLHEADEAPGRERAAAGPGEVLTLGIARSNRSKRLWKWRREWTVNAPVIHR